MLLAKISNGGQVDRQHTLNDFFWRLITGGESIGDKSAATVMMMQVVGGYCLRFSRESQRIAIAW